MKVDKIICPLCDGSGKLTCPNAKVKSNRENMKEITESKVCSGCGAVFPSVHPEKYYQFCSVECREIVEDCSEVFIDQQHTIKLISNHLWVINKLKELSL